MMAGPRPIGANLSGAAYRTTVMAGRGRATPGHDDGVRTCPLNLALMGPRPAMAGEDRAFARNHP